jgi:glutaredoxin
MKYFKSRKTLTVAILFLVLAFVSRSPFTTKAEEVGENQDTEQTLKLHLFHSKTCPHCKEEIAFIETLQEEYPQIELRMHEITPSRKTKSDVNLFKQVGETLNVAATRVPFLVIGHEVVVGFNSPEGTGETIKRVVEKELANPSEDIVTVIRENLEAQEKAENNNDKSAQVVGEVIKVPFLGLMNTNELSLGALTVVLGLLDGFNPCAMWVLLFLITLLLNMQNRKKMWVLGTTFILASGFVYFLFMVAWLNFFIFLGYTSVVRVVVGFAAAGAGLYYIRKYQTSLDGCDLEGSEKRKVTFEKIRAVIQKNNIFLAAGGMVLLAFAVNVVELLCSAGFPAIFTKVLSMNHLPTWKYYSYIVGYILMFMLDDLVVFAIAMFTLKSVGIDSKYGKYSHLVGGIIMLGIGILLLFKPELLMFS